MDTVSHNSLWLSSAIPDFYTLLHLVTFGYIWLQFPEGQALSASTPSYALRIIEAIVSQNRMEVKRFLIVFFYHERHRDNQWNDALLPRPPQDYAFRIIRAIVSYFRGFVKRFPGLLHFVTLAASAWLQTVTL